MAHVSHKLSNSLEGALAGGGDPATSPLYVFGPFLKLIVVAGVAQITFGVSLWLVVFTIAMVSAMYRLVMRWVVDGSGGSGLSEEEFGSWAVKVNASITFIEYTLTFLVSMAALVTFIADRVPLLNAPFLGFQVRTFLAIGLSILTGWLVNRGPRMAARTFGPATAAVLLLLWVMVIATVWQRGLQLPDFNLDAFRRDNLGYTFGGYARILAVMTGIEIFANLVAAYEGPSAEKSRKAFGSLLIIMGTTAVTMLVVGPAIFALADPTNADVSVFTQTMDQLLPAPLPWLGTLIGVAVLLSASAASAQGLQNLALGLKLRHYVPASIGRQNRFDVAPAPVWIEIAIVAFCFLLLGTHEETYLAIYAAGVFILLSMTGWAAAKRLLRELRSAPSLRHWLALAGTAVAALLTSGATLIIFGERFREGAWTYLVFIPLLYLTFSLFRRRLGEPTPLEEQLGRMLAERRYLPDFSAPPDAAPDSLRLRRILVPLDGSSLAEQALVPARTLCQRTGAEATLLTVVDEPVRRARTLSRYGAYTELVAGAETEMYLQQTAVCLEIGGVTTQTRVQSGSVPGVILTVMSEGFDLLVMSTHGRSGLQRLLIGSVAAEIIQHAHIPMLLLRPGEDWRSRSSGFKRLLVALDGSDFAERALPHVRMLARRFGSEVLLLTVPAGQISEHAHRQLEDYLARVAGELQAAGILTRCLVTGSGPARTIVRVGHDECVDLIMMATHGRGGLDKFMLGSVADRVIQDMICPVYLVPGAAPRP